MSGGSAKAAASTAAEVSNSNNPLVWVRQPSSNNVNSASPEKLAAFLIFQENGQSLVEWASSQRQEWVQNSTISYRCSPRRHHRKRRLLQHEEQEEASSSNTDTPNQRKLATDGTSRESSSNNDAASDDDDGDDDEVEFLLTIMPPSPKKKKAGKTSIITPASSVAAAAASAAITAPTTRVQSASQVPRSCNDTSFSDETTYALPKMATVPSMERRDRELSPLPRRALWDGAVHGNDDAPCLNLDKNEAAAENNSTALVTEAEDEAPSDPSLRYNLETQSPKFLRSRKDDGTNDSLSPAKMALTQTAASATAMDDPATTSDTLSLDIVAQHANINIAPASSSGDHPKAENASKSSIPANNSTGFTVRSSAYLQSLAEICHAISFDVRWRTEGLRQQPLFAWERGDDLSVVHALARRYIHTSTIQSNESFKCVCLLCRQEALKQFSVGAQPSPTSLPTQHYEQQSCSQTSQRDGPAHDGEGNGIVDVDDEEDECYDRALNLYARLYTRKGPWFRVDDIFKYYLPRKNHNTAVGRPSPESTNANNSNNKMPSPKKNSPTKFFLPRKANTNGSNNNKDDNDMIDSDKVNQLLECTENLIDDLKQLYRMGWIRSFHDEKECGLAVGETKKYGLLKQEEQRLILSKLGARGKGKAKVCYPNSNIASTATSSRTSSRSSNTKNGNLIWKQMCQQKSISSLISGATSTNSSGDPKTKSAAGSAATAYLLPVSKHVDEALLQSWATSIVMRASRVDYLPSAFLRQVSKSVKDHLEQVLEALNEDCCEELFPMTATTSVPKHRRLLSITCLRLREAPLKTLHRCCRLYLCATSGPGDMRGDGLNSWRSLPNAFDNRSSNEEEEGGNAEVLDLPFMTQTSSRPGSYSWHQMSYPGRDYRFKLKSCNFIRAHEPLLLTQQNSYDGGRYSSEQLQRLQVFPKLVCFLVWELCVDIRANVDYLIELNELIQYNERKRAREEAVDVEAMEDVKNAEPDDDVVSDSPESVEIDDEPAPRRALDFMNVLTIEGRDQLIGKFCTANGRPMEPCATSLVAAMTHELEKDVDLLIGNEDEAGQSSQLQGECELILGMIATISIHVLAFRSQTATKDETLEITSRPWLRHLRWEGCLAYLLWDIIPIIEKRGYHEVAVKALEVLLFGRLLPRTSHESVIPSTLVPTESSNDDGGGCLLSEVYLSRRARGKAYERLIIDYVHLLRRRQKAAEKIAADKKIAESSATKQEPKTKKKRQAAGSKQNTPKKPTANDMAAGLCVGLLKAYVPTGQITFCAVRTLARRLKEPLSNTLSGILLFEPGHLGHRLTNDTSNKNEDEPTKTGKYVDWIPITDFAVANSMSTGDETLVGKRCRYIGFEDDNEQKPNYGSLNVEELAMEFYHSGRLPESKCSVKGGWVGWHDEGGKIRALFRILSSAAILGMDWGCKRRQCSVDLDWATIHLTPYQGAPFDLHVGAELSSGRSAPSTTIQGFYGRRTKDISTFLEALSQLTADELSSLVYDTINTRLVYVRDTGYNDPTLERDVQQVRTLSLLAAGFGGMMLSAVFRCFFFDYRHYSGGLPDLLMVRALYDDAKIEEDDNRAALVDLGEWVGETFSPEHQSEEQARKVISMFEDRDEEFLGCSKVGDSGGRTTNSFSRRGRQSFPAPQEQHQQKPPLEMPAKLELTHKGRKVLAECMFVEVKSQNDRLDARQEDWLNILDKHGNARVCKFGKAKKVKGKENRKSGINNSAEKGVK